MKKLSSYANKRFKALIDSLHSYHQIDEPEVLHSLRVELKKIKSILNLLQYGLPNFRGHKHYIPFRTIFRRAGEIRQPEVIYKLLLQNQIEGITDSQIPNADQEERLLSAFKNDVPMFIATVTAKRSKLKEYIKNLTEKKAGKYLTKRRRQVKRLLFPVFEPDALHKTRKIIKEIIFLDWVDKDKPSVTFLKKIENRIGQWHDKQVLLKILNSTQYKDQSAILIASCQEDLVNLKMAIQAHYGKGKI
ncbi:MAG: CHAD domain-containing protein [Cytophagales bacterium]|nr:CHAD domain-containing protein [Cytophagales bacterium]MCA6367323.1 CHAD domain-containing protein [Cytophagales bacterium]MCA6371680.1 CHAD domain-containing protein [Cytophagales bacterium]MCA6376192.1 CHAD domain-containing protein [Cytophagales bacterium]MCA6384012.1 CHAD domain-containing protein [Cytophagales bacterium]